MSNYKVETLSGTYVVVEQQTGHHVWETKNEAAARSRCRDLNLGAGFDGWSPEFFCKKMQNNG